MIARRYTYQEIHIPLRPLTPRPALDPVVLRMMDLLTTITS